MSKAEGHCGGVGVGVRVADDHCIEQDNPEVLEQEACMGNAG